MSIIKLKNVSKFYYSKGVVASGFSRVNLEFDIGEFVAITGESGSGKSTLLNVISGIDTYEEGELYINGEETSHYIEKDFENYRRKYIGNIFQNFNLVNSYTVYQNIELVLLLNGKRKKDIKNKVLELIKKVGLYKFRNTKASKLSGGQKQRVAIARALAKDTPIIIADEPTGNLDSKSSKEIIKLLSEISKDKLVIIVTHNYEQVEPYVTRKIKMHDGKILEDKKIKDTPKVKNVNLIEYKNITLLNRFRLAFRNTFNILPKFLLLLLVYLFMTISLISEYASFKEQEYINKTSGYNSVFRNTSDKRIVINKKDRTIITNDDFDKIKKISNISYIMKNDLLLDTMVTLTDDNNLWLDGYADNINNFKETLDVGRMPKAENEIIIAGNKDDYYIKNEQKKLLQSTLNVRNFETGELENIQLKVVGIKYNKSKYDYNYNIYLNDQIIDKIGSKISANYDTIKVLFMNKYRESNYYSTEFNITPSKMVEKGQIYISSDYEYECPKENCINQTITIEIKNIYTSKTKDFNIAKTYNKKNLNKLLGIDNYDDINGKIFINESDYNELFNKDTYQSSVFVKDVTEIDQTIKDLEKLGYKTLALKDSLVDSEAEILLQVLRTIVTIILVVVLIFVSYFVIKIILKSRNKYYTTIRILGANKSISIQLLVYELIIVFNIAYFLFMIFLYLNKINILNVKFTESIFTYLKLRDYIILYFILIFMSFVLSMKYSKKLFKNSAISTMNMEV